jgi:HAD superfamily hydrolase (TIGR01509 family)
MDIKAVIFDRDGVIVDTESIHVDSTLKALGKLGVNVSRSDLEFIHGRHPDDYKSDIMSRFSISYPEFREHQKDFYYEIFDTAEVFEDIISVIKLLHSKSMPVAITTSASSQGTWNLLNRIGLEGAFSVVVTKDDCQKRKPDPEPYILTAKKLNIAPKHCIVVEDSGVGVEAAKNAGMTCIAVPSEYTKNQDFSRADYVLDSLGKVGDIFRQVGLIR